MWWKVLCQDVTQIYIKILKYHIMQIWHYEIHFIVTKSKVRSQCRIWLSVIHNISRGITFSFRHNRKIVQPIIWLSHHSTTWMTFTGLMSPGNVRRCHRGDKLMILERIPFENCKLHYLHWLYKQVSKQLLEDIPKTVISSASS